MSSYSLVEIGTTLIALGGLFLVARKRSVGFRLLGVGVLSAALSGCVATAGPAWLDCLKLLAAGIILGGVVYLMLLRDRKRGLLLIAVGLLALTVVPLISAVRESVVRNLRIHHALLVVSLVVILALLIAALVFLRERFAARGSRLHASDQMERSRRSPGMYDRYIPRAVRRTERREQNHPDWR